MNIKKKVIILYILNFTTILVVAIVANVVKPAALWHGFKKERFLNFKINTK
jgi:hypothetical protein